MEWTPEQQKYMNLDYTWKVRGSHRGCQHWMACKYYSSLFLLTSVHFANYIRKDASCEGANIKQNLEVVELFFAVRTQYLYVLFLAAEQKKESKKWKRQKDRPKVDFSVAVWLKVTAFWGKHQSLDQP